MRGTGEIVVSGKYGWLSRSGSRCHTWMCGKFKRLVQVLIDYWWCDPWDFLIVVICEWVFDFFTLMEDKNG